MSGKVCILITAICLLSLWVVTDTAFAGEVKVQGKGALWARGTGIAHIVGKGVVKLRVNGAGVIRIRNIDDCEIELHGVGRKKRAGDTLYIYGLKGTVKVKSKSLNVRFSGGKVTLHAWGKGAAFLKGRGKYRIRGGSPNDWPEDGARVTYKD